MAHIIKCRICHKEFDTETIPFVKVGQRSYYHESCYYEWKQVKDDPEALVLDKDGYYEAIVDYLYRDMKMSVDFFKLKSQFENFTKSTKKKMTPKGIFLSLKYFYEVQHGDPTKAAGGIGIVQSVYDSAAVYWQDQVEKKTGFYEQIMKELDERMARKVVKVEQIDLTKKDKARFKLDEI